MLDQIRDKAMGMVAKLPHKVGKILLYSIVFNSNNRAPLISLGFDKILEIIDHYFNLFSKHPWVNPGNQL